VMQMLVRGEPLDATAGAGQEAPMIRNATSIIGRCHFNKNFFTSVRGAVLSDSGVAAPSAARTSTSVAEEEEEPLLS
jgi:hypothetical protein